MTGLSFQHYYLYKFFLLEIPARSALQEYLQGLHIYLYIELANVVNETDASYLYEKRRADTAVTEQKKV